MAEADWSLILQPIAQLSLKASTSPSSTCLEMLWDLCMCTGEDLTNRRGKRLLRAPGNQGVPSDIHETYWYIQMHQYVFLLWRA